MFPEMRRRQQQLSSEESIQVLKNGIHGVLAVLGQNGYPYTVPLSYVYEKGKIFFHCAKTGYKLEALKKEDKVSFCVVDQDDIVPEEYTTYFRSVIVFGRARILQNEEEKRQAIQLLARRYSPMESDLHLHTAIEKGIHALCMVELNIEHMTGKEAIELVRKKADKKLI